MVLVLNHSSAYTVFCLHSCFQNLKKPHNQRTPCSCPWLGVDPLQLFLKGSGHITHYVMIIIRYRPLRCSYKPLLLLAYIKALPWVAIVYSKSRWMDGYVHMIKEVLGRQHRKKSAARYSFAECQYSRLLKVARLVIISNCKYLRWGIMILWFELFRFVHGLEQHSRWGCIAAFKR